MDSEVEQYRAFIANSAEGIWRFETDEPIPTHLSDDEQIDRFYRTAYLAECNDAFARMYGFATCAEMVGVRLGDLLPRTVAENVAYLRAFIHGGYRLTDVESIENGRDGRMRHFANSLVGTIENGALVRVWGTQRDITGERERERDLARREREYAALVENAMDVLARFDREKRIVYINAAGETHTGKPAALLTGKTIREAGFADSIVSTWDAALDRVLTTGAPQRIEFSHPYPQDGTTHHYETVLTPEEAIRPGGNREVEGIVSLTRDVTERRQAEEALKANEARYRRMLDISIDGILFIDPDERMTYVNRRMAKMLGYYSPEDLTGRLIYDILFDEDIPAAIKRRAMRRQGISGQYEVRMRRKDATECWGLVSVMVIQDTQTGAYLGTYAITIDITENKRAQIERDRALTRRDSRADDTKPLRTAQPEGGRAGAEEFRLLVDGIRDYAIFLLDPQGHVSTWNVGAQRFKGYTAEEIIGKHFSQFYTQEDIAARHPWHELEIATREGRFEEEGWRVRKDGSRFWANVVITALRDEHGTLRGFGKVTRDITERREREQERVAAERAEQQRRFLKDVLASVTQGKLVLCEFAGQLPAPVTSRPAGASISLNESTLKTVRTRVTRVAQECAIPPERAQDFVTAVSECAMNAVVHAGSGIARVYGDAQKGMVQVFIEDKGAGIDLSHLPYATLERGYSTGGIGIGHGFWLMLQTCDRLYLLTGRNGTTVVLEQYRTPPYPSWISKMIDRGSETSYVHP